MHPIMRLETAVILTLEGDGCTGSQIEEGLAAARKHYQQHATSDIAECLEAARLAVKRQDPEGGMDDETSQGDPARPR